MCLYFVCLSVCSSLLSVCISISLSHTQSSALLCTYRSASHPASTTPPRRAPYDAATLHAIPALCCKARSTCSAVAAARGMLQYRHACQLVSSLCLASVSMLLCLSSVHSFAWFSALVCAFCSRCKATSTCSALTKTRGMLQYRPGRRLASVSVLGRLSSLRCFHSFSHGSHVFGLRCTGRGARDAAIPVCVPPSERPLLRVSWSVLAVGNFV